MSLSRRDFVRSSALALLAGALPRGLYARSGAAGVFRELRCNVGIFTLRGGTIGWLVDPAGTVVVDSQFPDSAAVCRDGLRDRGAAVIDALINTHHHGDHTAGNATFRESARRIVAHQRVPELQRRVAQAAGSEAAQSYADTTFDHRWSLDVGGETVRAQYHGAAHTAGDCVVTFQSAGVVHMGDLVFNRAYPFVDRAGGASIEGWIRVLDEVVASHDADTLYVFGHASRGFDVVGPPADVLLQRDFLSAVMDVARRAVAAGRSREEATAMDRLPGFADHAPIAERLSLGNVIGAAFDELAGAR
jgi:cyclase